MTSKRPPFVHLNVHSAFSLQAGACLPEVLAARASVDGHETLALTDTDGAYALPPFQDLCDAAGIRAIHGAEIHERENARERVTVLVKDASGYRSLCRLLTRRKLDERFELEDDLAELSEGLVVLTPSLRLLHALHDVLAEDDLYGEVVAHAPGKTKRALVAKAVHLDRPLAGTHRTFFTRAAEHNLHRLQLAIGHLKFFREIVPGALGRDGTPLDVAPKDAWLMPPKAAAAAFADLPQAAENTVGIAERCRYRFERPAKPRLPDLELPLESADDEPAYGHLASLCLDGIKRRYGRVRPDVLARLERELRVIRDRGFCDYFLIVHGMVRFAGEQSIPVVGRGSAANSIVAYALGITSVDPLRYDLPFERFLSPARKDCPDIDLDIDWRGRDAVIEHAYETYGSDRVAMICTHVTFQARGAVREAAKTFGLAPPEVDRVAKHLPWQMDDVGKRDGFLRKTRLPPELADLPLTRPPWSTAIRAAVALDGLPRHLSIHPGGIVIGDGVLQDSLPLERSAKGLVVTQYDMHGVEATGLVKIDLLGNRALAVIADVSREAQTTYGDEIDLDRIPEDDVRTADLLRTGQTLGCFQVESPGMRNLVVRMEARTQDDAMIALSLIRPGPAGSGMKDAYIRRRRGEEETPTLHPAIDPLFSHTHGVMLYQEDTLRAAAAVAGFSLEQADHLRRALSKKREPEDLPSMEAAFREQAVARDMPKAVIDEVWASIQRFSAYAYNKAHAATYGRISWKALYLKARYPAEYLAAVLQNGAGFYAPRAYVEDARRLGARIDLPCVNRSEVGPVGRRGALRLGLNQVKGLKQGTPEALVRIRESSGPYLSPTDLLLRTSLEKHEVERLVFAGALDVFDRPRGELLWILQLDFDRYVKARAETKARSVLFGPTAMLPKPRTIPVPATYSPDELLDMEVESLGLTASFHPSELLGNAQEEYGAVPTTELASHAGKTVKVVGWVVTERRVRTRARDQGDGHAQGRYMKFLMLEDLHGTVEVTLFPRWYAIVGHRLSGAGPYVITGRVRQDHGALTLDARNVEKLRPTRDG